MRRHQRPLSERQRLLICHTLYGRQWRIPMPVAAGAKRERVVLGMFDTAVEAAKHYVLWLQDPIGATEALKAGDAERMRQAEELVEQRGLVREAEGVRLFLSPFTFPVDSRRSAAQAEGSDRPRDYRRRQ